MKKDELYYQDFKELADLFFCITENKILKERIEKAIEIIEKHKDYETEGLLVEETINLLNILRGNNE